MASGSGSRKRQGAARSSASPFRSQLTHRRRGRLPQVLIIDDDPELLNVCRVGLEALGHAVLTTETGGDGMAETAISRPDVVVLDLGLPDLDGVDVCRRIR